ncbi:MAG: efflux RND transporter periplasmic adaptor subunit [Bacteroidota bacterium]
MKFDAKQLAPLVLTALISLGVGYFWFGGDDSNSEKEPEIETVEGRWTCSMHPEIDGEENGTCPICGMDLVFMPHSHDEGSPNHFEMTAQAIALANVQTLTVGESSGKEISIPLSGKITTNKNTDAVQTILYDGRIDEFYANTVGKKVRKGQAIGKVYSPELYLAQDKLLTSVSYRDSHQKLYDAARNTLGLWKVTDAQIEEMLKSGKPMDNFPLYADVSGTIVEVLGAKGQFYKQGDALYRIADLSTVWAELEAHENHLANLAVGQSVELQTSALPGTRITGKVALIEPILQTHQRVAKVRVVIPNSYRLKPGMFVEATVKGNSQNNAILLPKSAVLWTGKRSLVYKKVHTDQTVFEALEVELGQSYGNEYEILDGLNLGDEIVTNGTFTLDAAAQLQGKLSMTSLPKVKPEAARTDKDLSSPVPIQIESDSDISTVLNHYFGLKNALVASDFKIAQGKVKALGESIKAEKHINHTKLPSLIQTLVEAKDLEAQRKAFKPFSKDFLAFVKQHNGLEETLYVQYCPMADNNRGGFWLSLQEEIRNPYFGDKMLICGKVTEVLKQ